MRTLWFATIVLTALLMGLTWAHTLEMPQKLSVDGPTWLTFQHTLYRYFAVIGAPIEMGAIVAAVVLACVTRRRSHRHGFVTAAAVLLIMSLGVWAGVVRPVNASTATWTVETLPEDWEQARLQWELGHALSFALHFLAFSALLMGLLQSPATVPRAGDPKSKNLGILD